MVEAKKLAFADRERWAADPRSLEAPLAELLSADYAARLAAGIDMRRAAPTPIAPPPPTATRPISAPPTATATRFPGVQSINSGFGSGIIAGDTGILLNNRMSLLAPRSRPSRITCGRGGGCATR